MSARAPVQAAGGRRTRPAQGLCSPRQVTMRLGARRPGSTAKMPSVGPPCARPSRCARCRRCAGGQKKYMSCTVAGAGTLCQGV